MEEERTGTPFPCLTWPCGDSSGGAMATTPRPWLLYWVQAKKTEQERIDQRKKRDGAAAAVEEKEEGRLGFGEGIGGLGLEEGGRKGGEGAGGGDRWWCGGFGGGQ